MLLALAEQGCHDLAVVPSDDLHLVPWAHLLADALPTRCALRVHPSGSTRARRGRQADGQADTQRGANARALGAGPPLAGQRVRSAHHLPAIKTCRRATLSCCVLGPIDVVLGEALGFYRPASATRPSLAPAG